MASGAAPPLGTEGRRQLQGSGAALAGLLLVSLTSARVVVLVVPAWVAVSSGIILLRGAPGDLEVV